MHARLRGTLPRALAPRSAATLLGAGALALGACALDEKRPLTLRSGERVYQEVCSACHGAGVEKAPPFGDRAAWTPLIEEGQPVLTAHAWVGVRGMPPRGGDPTLSLEEFARAAAFMARAAGGDWRDPDAAMLERIRDEVEDRIEDLRTGATDDD